MASHNIFHPVRSQTSRMSADAFGIRLLTGQALNKKNSGFTMIEILVVIGILGMILVFGLITTMDSFKRSTLQAEQETLVSALEKARSRSMNNINESKWGVCYDKSNPSKPNYIIFKDNPYVVIDKIEANSAISISVVPPLDFSCSNGIVFEQLNGKLYPQLSPAETEFVITMTQDLKTSKISINNEGRIDW